MEDVSFSDKICQTIPPNVLHTVSQIIQQTVSKSSSTCQRVRMLRWFKAHHTWRPFILWEPCILRRLQRTYILGRPSTRTSPCTLLVRIHVNQEYHHMLLRQLIVDNITEVIYGCVVRDQIRALSQILHHLHQTKHF